jgi:hypothetical protein
MGAHDLDYLAPTRAETENFISDESYFIGPTVPMKPRRLFAMPPRGRVRGA